MTTPQQPLRLLRPIRSLRALGPHEHDALVAAARRRATELREEAKQEFFAAMFRALRRAWHALRRQPVHARC